jgi:hypothetical protein
LPEPLGHLRIPMLPLIVGLYQSKVSISSISAVPHADHKVFRRRIRSRESYRQIRGTDNQHNAHRKRLEMDRYAALIGTKAGPLAVIRVDQIAISPPGRILSATRKGPSGYRSGHQYAMLRYNQAAGRTEAKNRCLHELTFSYSR